MDARVGPDRGDCRGRQDFRGKPPTTPGSRRAAGRAPGGRNRCAVRGPACRQAWSLSGGDRSTARGVGPCRTFDRLMTTLPVVTRSFTHCQPADVALSEPPTAVTGTAAAGERLPIVALVGRPNVG